jgi:O-methyltransferase
MTTDIRSLIAAHNLISNQVDKDDVTIILEQLDKVLEQGTPGSIIEFGCYIGTTSLFIRRLLNAKGENRAFHVYDSFAGLPLKRKEDNSPVGAEFQSGKLAVSKKQFLREFQRTGLVPPIIHKCWFEQLTTQDIPNAIAFAFLDGDFYSSMRASLHLVMPKLSPGGIVIVHDYAREALPGVARAVYESGLRPVVRHNLGIITAQSL